jgi:hypothetical protein
MTQYEHYELKRIDAEIAELEARISLKQEQRREIINRKDLNKCSHKNQVIFPGLYISDVMVKSGYLFCTDCGNKDFGKNEIKNSSNNSPIASEWSAR